jgi:ketol-acid reductoisomerase
MVNNANIHHNDKGDLSLLKDKLIGIIGYGNQGKAHALNMRDSGLEIIVGTSEEKHKQRAINDQVNFQEISDVIEKADFIFLLVSDQEMIPLFEQKIKPHLTSNKTLVFYSGYNLAFDLMEVPESIDVLLISPRTTGLGVRENYLNKKGFFTIIGIHQDSSGNAKQNLLALTKALGGLSKGAIELTLKQAAVLNLFRYQAFTYAFTQILMRSVNNLIEEGYPPEAVLIEILLSGEGSYTVDKMVDIGLIKQMKFHSQTSQYGSLSRAVKFRKVASEVEEVQRKILKNIESGKFASDWQKDTSKTKLEALKALLKQSKFAEIEAKVRDKLNIPDISEEIKANYPHEADKMENMEKAKKFYNEI